MGIEDRDYYREKYKKRTNQENTKLFKQSNNWPRKTGKNSTVIKNLLYSILMLFTLMYWANVLLDKIKSRKIIQPELIAKIPLIASPKPPDLISGGVILQIDRNGHFRGTVLINNVPLPFLIDTGATQTVIPTNMAVAAGLPFGRSIQSNTAGGQIFEQKTHITSLKIGTAEIRELDASINQHLDEVLIGMNTLKYFHMTQNVNTLTLVAFTKPEEIAEIERGLTVPVPAQIITTPDYRTPIVSPVADQPYKSAKTTWKKTVICEGANCRTSYR